MNSTSAQSNKESILELIDGKDENANAKQNETNQYNSVVMDSDDYEVHLNSVNHNLMFSDNDDNNSLHSMHSMDSINSINSMNHKSQNNGAMNNNLLLDLNALEQDNNNNNNNNKNNDNNDNDSTNEIVSDVNKNSSLQEQETNETNKTNETNETKPSK